MTWPQICFEASCSERSAKTAWQQALGKLLPVVGKILPYSLALAAEITSQARKSRNEETSPPTDELIRILHRVLTKEEVAIVTRAFFSCSTQRMIAQELGTQQSRETSVRAEKSALAANRSGRRLSYLQVRVAKLMSKGVEVVDGIV